MPILLCLMNIENRIYSSNTSFVVTTDTLMSRSEKAILMRVIEKFIEIKWYPDYNNDVYIFRIILKKSIIYLKYKYSLLWLIM